MAMQEHHDKVAGLVSSSVQLRGKEETRPWHLARASARAERRRREREEIAEAISLGVGVVPKVSFNTMWQEWEEDILRARPTDLEGLKAALPHRSAMSIRNKRLSLGLKTHTSRAWTTTEERIVRDNYLKVKNIPALAKMLPGRDRTNIVVHMRKMGLRIVPPAFDTGSDIVDAIRDRCRVLGYSMRELDRIAKTGKYFAQHRYNGSLSNRIAGNRVTQMSAAMTKAVRALGGTMRVDWPDDGESIDTIDVGETKPARSTGREKDPGIMTRTARSKALATSRGGSISLGE